MAKFKTRLFIFFAGRLLKWAESIEREIGGGQSPPATVVDDSNAEVFAEPARESESASGPPEHWARLVASGPPEHWLDLLRQKAPHLLPPLASDPVSSSVEDERSTREYSQTDSDQEANSQPAGAEGALEGLPLHPILRPKQNRGETRQAATEPGNKTWLSRLRFRPPARKVENFEPVYIANQTGQGDSPRAAGGADERGSKSTPGQRPTEHRRVREQSLTSYPEQTIAAQQSIARFSVNPEDEERLNDRHPHPHVDEDVVVLQRKPGGPVINDSLLESSLKEIPSEQTMPEDVREVHHIRLNSPAERGARPATNARSRSRNNAIPSRHVESSASDQGSRFAGLNQVRPLKFERRDGTTSSTQSFHQARMDQAAGEPKDDMSAHTKSPEIRKVEQGREVRTAAGGLEGPMSVAMANEHLRNQPLFSREPAKNVANDNQQSRIQFPSVELAAPGPIQSRIESNENVWPALPPAPRFDIADELAAMEHEAETLRRLDQEQRGILWNA